MSLYTRTPRNSSHADHPFNAGQRRRCGDTVLGQQRLVVNSYGSDHAAKAARAATIDAFGRHAWALDHGDFVDRPPNATSVPSPEARFK